MNRCLDVLVGCVAVSQRRADSNQPTQKTCADCVGRSSLAMRMAQEYDGWAYLTVPLSTLAQLSLFTGYRVALFAWLSSYYLELTLLPPAVWRCTTITSRPTLSNMPSKFQPACLSSSSCASDLALPRHCARLHIIFTYLTRLRDCCITFNNLHG